MQHRNSIIAVLALGAVVGAVWAAPTATLTLTSTKNGQTVSAGTTIDWTVKVAVSTGDNAGLALVSSDLVQNDTNPAFFDIPPGNVGTIDSTMDDFSRPLGVSNPGEGGATTGYIGVQRGTAGHKNLIQIGGGQNTVGAIGPSGIGQDFTVNGLVGQGGSPRTVLSGSFPAPAVGGTYTFHLENGVVNVLTAVNPAPQFSPVVQATANAASATFSFTVGGVLLGDMNCDGLVNSQDIDGFVYALFGLAAQYDAYLHSFPVYHPCSMLNADFSGDGLVNSQDIDGFIAALF